VIDTTNWCGTHGDKIKGSEFASFGTFTALFDIGPFLIDSAQNLDKPNPQYSKGGKIGLTSVNGDIILSAQYCAGMTTVLLIGARNG